LTRVRPGCVAEIFVHAFGALDDGVPQFQAK
jgi:hypothetical protein